jgi:hypothetical protein
MARLRHRLNGVVVNVPDERVAELSGDFEPVEVKKAPAKRAAAKSDK